MKLTKRIWLFTILIFLISCQNNQADRKGSNQGITKVPKTITLFSDSIENAVIDSTIIANVGTIVVRDNYLYMCQGASPHIVISTPEFHLVNSFSPQGEGPGESNKIENMAVNDSLIIIYDNWRRAFSVFKKNGVFIKSIPAKVSDALLTSFAIQDNKLYFSNFTDSSTIEEVSLKTNELNKFIKEIYPSAFNDTKSPFKRFNNARYILPYKNNMLITVGQSQPFIDIYDLNGKKISGFDLKNIPSIREEFDKNRSKTKTEPSFLAKTISLVKEVKIYDSSLYLLTIEKYQNYPTCNKILKFNIAENNKINFVGSFLLLKSKSGEEQQEQKIAPQDYPWISSFAISNGQLIAFTAKDEFYTYNFKNY